MFAQYHFSSVFIFLLLPALVSFIALLQFLPDATILTITQEGGLVEMLSAVGYFVCVAALLIVTRGKVSTCWHAIIILLGMAARELDFQRIWTTQTITKGRYYFNADNPLLERLIVIAALAVLVYAVVSLAKEHLRNYFSALKKRRIFAISITMAGALVVVSKLFDGSARKLADWNIIITDSQALLSESIEEVLEMGVPIALLVAILTLPINREPRNQSDE